MGIRPKCECIPSAFKAVQSFNQAVTALSFVQVPYSNEIFDLNDEYLTPTFTPQQDGTYTILASAAFNPANVNADSFIGIQIRVNGITVAQGNEGYVAGMGNVVVDVSSIEQLNAGDMVEIFVQAGSNGTIFLGPGTRFQAARFTFES